MSAEASFPLDAEQIVRLTAAVLTEVYDLPPNRLGELTLRLADAAGVCLPVEVHQTAHGPQRVLLGYAEVTSRSRSSLQPMAGGGDDADV